MFRYFDAKKWEHKIKHPDWYVDILNELNRLFKKTKEVDKFAFHQIKEKIYIFFEGHLKAGNINLGTTGRPWDEDRDEINTIVIHHSKNNPGITLNRLSAIGLIRLYVKSYALLYKSATSIPRQPIYSGHFRNNEQVFYAYHWLVRMNGSVERLLNDSEIGWHSGNWKVNRKSIAICLDNNFEHIIPDEEILVSVVNLIKEQYPNIPKTNVVGHREINQKTTCPGNYFCHVWKQKILKYL